ncbi:hypothetical protein [Arthrobacter sp. YN]|uniref:hypothetical protein n=1 Tax=Arthrobacter sp. YN TaxID=2020486 RepID=UPI000B610320|nr:hypothetical protein [Arthrobacter sp. YN]ASN20666.1 hypothetical protein CGK93_14000 [Arthrobacter sp. YN]
MTTQFREPTGKPSWPILLIAGGEKAGKSYASAKASASELIGQTYWVGVGEDDPDEYGAIEGARFLIAKHDGTHKSILAALRDASNQPRVDGKPNLLVLDSGTRVWEMLSDEAQERANMRAKKTAEKWKKPYDPDAEATIGPDLWNKATARWQDVMDVMREHDGPSIITARLDIVAVMDDKGQPTKDKTQKIKGQKSLPFDVGAIVEMPERGSSYLTGVRSLKLDLPVGNKVPVRDFSVDWLWRKLGLDAEGATAPRQYSSADGQASAAVPEEEAPQQQRMQQAPPANPNEDAGAQALHARQAAARAATPVWGDEQAEQLEVRLYEAKGNVDLLRSIWKSAQGMGAPQAVLDRIANINKPQAAPADTTQKEMAAA